MCMEGVRMEELLRRRLYCVSGGVNSLVKLWFTGSFVWMYDILLRLC